MNRRNLSIRYRTGLALVLCTAGLNWTLPVRGESAGQPGQRGEADPGDSFNFTQLAERERREGLPATRSLDRPLLHRSSAPRLQTQDAPPPAGQRPASRARGFTAASGDVPSPPLSASFQALPDDDRAFNPDTHGAVGPNHLMVTLASQVRVQNRAGDSLQTLSLETFWGTIGESNVFDPRVLYDRAAQRWIATAHSNPGTNRSSLLIAVSQTSDPTGVWFRRSVRTDLSDGVFPDSPNVGLTRDWITVSANMFSKTNYSYFSCDLWAFNKADLYAGGAGQFTFFRYLGAWLGEASVLVPVVDYDNGTNNMLVSNFDGKFETDVGTFGYLRLFSISGPVGAEVFNDLRNPGGTNGLYVILFNPWETFPPNFENFAPQKGTANKVYVGDARVQNVVYRDGFLWLCQHVFLPAAAPTHTALQWMSITPGGAVLQSGQLEDSAGVKSYAYPSLAVNAAGDMLIGFTSFSASQFPTAGYVFHSYADLDVLHLEGVAKAGETNFFINDRGVNHWGDWSATVVDPTNDSDFWTLQEYAAAHVSGESRWGTWWGRVSAPTDLMVAQTDAPDPVSSGGNVTYSVGVTNLLFTSATGVRILDTLPTGAVFVSATASQGSCSHVNGVVTCNFGDLAGESGVTATLVVRLDREGTAANSVIVSSLGPDQDPANNAAQALTTVRPAADLAVLMTSSSNPVTVNNTLIYSVTVTNRGPVSASAVTLTDLLPPGIVFLSTSPTACAQNAGVVTCNLGALAGGASSTVQIQVRPTVAGALTNRATVVSSVSDLNTGDNSSTNVTRANAPPTMADISNRTIDEDASLAPIEFTVGDLETPAGNLVLTGLSSNPTIVPHGNIRFGGSGSLRQISVTPLPNANGIVVITRILTDADGAATTNSFLLTVAALNDPPTIANLPSEVTLQEDELLGPLPFGVDDAESGPGPLTLSGASSDPTLIPNANISFAGSGAARTLTARPATNQSGRVTLTVTLSDGVATSSRSFDVILQPVNDLPVLGAVPDQVMDEDSSLTIPVYVNDVETPPAQIELQAVSSNQALLDATGFRFGGSGTNRTLALSPRPNASDSTTIITIHGTDGASARTSVSFTLRVRPVADPIALRVERRSNRVVISWSVEEGAGWTLQGSPALGRSAAWSSVSGSPVVLDGRYTVTNQVTGSSLFFRLRQ